ncbi:MAG: ABC transporter ATP-binding protein [Gammaproteobacteria bacterium]|nr:ABC transporter ATP-binding protein [Gammaproteobacteria bacterium]
MFEQEQTEAARSADTDETVIRFVDIHKRYGSVQVLQGLDLDVKAGEVFGFLGKNGAGKSTAIRILMGISAADSGQIELFGQSVKKNRNALRQRVGYVAQEQNFYPWMTPETLGKFVRGFYPNWNKALFDSLADTLELPLHRRIGTFSGGMKAKLGLSVALGVQPELLVLDEPTAGMDPVARREFLDLVREQSSQSGATIFFSTHLIDEIESVADRIAIVDHGQSVYAGSLSALSKSIGAWSIAASEFDNEGLPGEFALSARRVLQDAVRRNRRELILQFEAEVPAVVQLDPGWKREELSLEDIFVAVVSKR